MQEHSFSIQEEPALPTDDDDDADSRSELDEVEASPSEDNNWEPFFRAFVYQIKPYFYTCRLEKKNAGKITGSEND